MNKTILFQANLLFIVCVTIFIALFNVASAEYDCSYCDEVCIASSNNFDLPLCDECQAYYCHASNANNSPETTTDLTGSGYNDYGWDNSNTQNTNQTSTTQNNTTQNNTPSYMSNVMSAGSYIKCVQYCNSIADSGDCFMACGEEYDPTSNAGNGSGNGYECEEGYVVDPKDSSNCIPECSSGWQYSYRYEECRGGPGAACLNDDECGSGYDCNSSNTCVTNFFGSFTGGEFGGGSSNSGTSSNGSGTSSGSGTSGGSGPTQPVAVTNQPIQLQNGQTAPQGTAVYTNGSGVTPSGQTLPPGSFQVPNGGVGNNFVLCANGALAAECRDENGNELPGAPLTINTGGAGNFGTVAGVGLIAGSKCGTGFNNIGGVCFPSSSITGLSNAPVYVILSNIFSWMMGIFTTLAVIAFVVSGIQYLMSAGDSDLAKSAKSNATNAIIGIIVGLSGFIIIKAIAAALSGQGYFF